MVNLSLYSIKAVILLDAEGNRVLAKYYGGENTTLKQQKQFEKGLFDKTKRAQGESVEGRVSSTRYWCMKRVLYAGEVILYDNQVVLYRSNIDIFFYVVGSMEENELILLSMLNAFYDAVSTLLRYIVEGNDERGGNKNKKYWWHDIDTKLRSALLWIIWIWLSSVLMRLSMEGKFV